jgi:hypothetical protein
MPFGDPDELKRQKALALRTLTQALADLVGIVYRVGFDRDYRPVLDLD